MKVRERKPAHVWGDVEVQPGETREVSLAVTQSYSSLTIPIPVIVRRGMEPGPSLFVTAAIHGDEINGTGAVRRMIQEESLLPKRGTLILAPVINILGFDRHSRYLPDRRDLNRCFPGSRKGSVAARMARLVFDEIVSRCDCGIDLHTAAVKRTNFPNLRADVSIPEVRRLATAFGCETILSGKGPEGSFRREACAVQCPTIVFEAGEVWKVEPAVVEYAVHGVTNVMIELGMIDGKLQVPPFRVLVEKAKWIRAERGGFLRFHVRPGDVVAKNQPLATNTSITGTEHSLLTAPFAGIVLGMTTLPAIGPGDAVVHLGHLATDSPDIPRIRAELPEGHRHERVFEQLASNILVFTPESRGDRYAD